MFCVSGEGEFCDGVWAPEDGGVSFEGFCVVVGESPLCEFVFGVGEAVCGVGFAAPGVGAAVCGVGIAEPDPGLVVPGAVCAPGAL